MVNSNYFNNFRNGEPVNEEFTAGQVVTYILLAIFGTGGAIASVWALVKVIIPRIVDARIEGEKDTREYSQKSASLEQLSRLSDSAAAHQVVAELLANSQDNEQRANEFIRAIVLNEIRELGKRMAGLETRQRMLTNYLLSGRLVTDEEKPEDDYEAWRKRKLNEIPNPADREAGTDES